MNALRINRKEKDLSICLVKMFIKKQEKLARS